MHIHIDFDSNGSAGLIFLSYLIFYTMYSKSKRTLDPNQLINILTMKSFTNMSLCSIHYGKVLHSLILCVIIYLKLSKLSIIYNNLCVFYVVCICVVLEKVNKNTVWLYLMTISKLRCCNDTLGFANNIGNYYLTDWSSGLLKPNHQNGQI